MGQCYSVSLRIKVKDEQGLIRALHNLLANAKKDHVNYGVAEFVKKYGKIDNVDNLVRLFIGGRDFEKVVQRGGWLKYTSNFDACYGWCVVMEDMFRVMAPFIMDKSNLYVYPDEGYEYFRVENGNAVWVH